MPLKIPVHTTNIEDAHEKWLQILYDIDVAVKDDYSLQKKAQDGLCLKARRLPVEVLGRIYAQYVDLLNRLYDAYLNNVQLQREAYITSIITIITKRMMELRKELQEYIVNDYIYVDNALAQLKETPFNIQIVVPYHYALDTRSEEFEGLLQKMWEGAIRRKRRAARAVRPKSPKPAPTPHESEIDFELDFFAPEKERRKTREEDLIEELEMLEEDPDDDIDSLLSNPSVHTLIPESFTNILLIQKHERFRSYYSEACMQRFRFMQKFREDQPKEAPLHIRLRAAELIQKVYRAHMKCKRQRMQDKKRDIILGIIPDPYRKRLDFDTENTKIYERRRLLRKKLLMSYEEDLEKMQSKLIRITKDNQIEDITSEIREWFKEWYYGYGLFPNYPFEAEGGTELVLKLEWPTPSEQRKLDEEYDKKRQGMTKEQIKAEAKQAKLEEMERLQAHAEMEAKKLEALVKARCNPIADPGYTVKPSGVDIQDVLTKYKNIWSALDPFCEADRHIIYGYIEYIMAEDLMIQIHKDCRKFVDELMRLELKLLIKRQRQMYKRMGLLFPKMKIRKAPKVKPLPPPVVGDHTTMKEFERFFDMNIITKPKTKLKEIIGDLNFHAYELNIKDPDASFPEPSLGDLRNHLVLSCIFGCGLNEGVERKNSVMLLGPPGNGKSFCVDAICGEMNAVKIDISPEVFSGVLPKANKYMTKILLAAKAFQPSVIYCRNVERIFYKKVPSAEVPLKPKTIKKGLEKIVKSILPEDKIIFIGTCSNPWAVKPKPLLKLFNEILLIPRTDYATLRLFFYDKLMSIRSIYDGPLEMIVQPLAQFFRGYGMGIVTRIYDQVMTPERIVKLNVIPLNFMEFVEPLIADDENIVEPVDDEEYKQYQAFWLKNSPFKEPREQYEEINKSRAIVYQKLAKQELKNAGKKT